MDLSRGARGRVTGSRSRPRSIGGRTRTRRAGAPPGHGEQDLARRAVQIRNASRRRRRASRRTSGRATRARALGPSSRGASPARASSSAGAARARSRRPPDRASTPPQRESVFEIAERASERWLRDRRAPRGARSALPLRFSPGVPAFHRRAVPPPDPDFPALGCGSRAAGCVTFRSGSGPAEREIGQRLA
jgi:hypothetical protein